MRIPLLTKPIALSALLAASPGLSAQAAPANIALNRSYTAYPKLGGNPRTDNGKEARKLTDGLRSAKPLWEDPEHTLGWRDGRLPVQIVIDLGKRQPISGISIGCGAGAAFSAKEIFIWPGLIDIFVSDDQKLWHPVAELTSLNDRKNEIIPAFDGKYAYRRIASNELTTAGRYVRIVISSRKEVFLDEIEVHRGDDKFLELPLAPGIPGEKIADAVIRKDATLFVSQRRQRLDIAAISAQLASLPEEKAAPIRRELEALKARVEAQTEQPQDKRAILPVGDVGRAILSQQAAVWRAQGNAPLTVWRGAPGAHLEWLASPTPDADPKLRIDLIRGEHRSASLNFTNATPQEQTFTLALAGHNADHLDVRSVEWTETVSRTAIAYALPPAHKVAEGYEITIPSGMTRQVWITAKGTGAPGLTHGSLRILPRDTSLSAREVPFDIHLYPIDFPEKQALHFSGWDYVTSWEKTRYGVVPATSRAFAKTLRDYRMDIVWAPGNIWPKGKPDANQQYPSAADQPDTAQFDTWVKEIMPGAERYHINISGRTAKNEAQFLGIRHDENPEAFDKGVATWLRFWEAHVKSIGMDPQQFSLLIIDEPGLDEANPYKEDASIRAWAEAIRKSGVNFRQWMDPVYKEPWNAYEPSIDAMDEICVKSSYLMNQGKRYVDYYRERSTRQQLSLYECYPTVGGFDPYSYYRLQAWVAWDMNANGIGFWSMADSGRTPSFGSWNNGLNPLHYCPLFLDEREVIPGKAMEAIREGISDYQYLVLLRDAIAQARSGGKKSAEIARAEKLLADAPAEVLWKNHALDEPKWLATTAIDRSVADRIRVAILDAIVSLR